jgi:hypothetical protein
MIRPILACRSITKITTKILGRFLGKGNDIFRRRNRALDAENAAISANAEQRKSCRCNEKPTRRWRLRFTNFNDLEMACNML